MPEINQLTQLVAIAEHGTISKAAQELHLSQPALSRSMQKLEEEMQVCLFQRQKNKIEFNENGKLAVEYAEKVIDLVSTMEEQVRQHDRKQRTISIGSCAPVPIWETIPALSDLYPHMTSSSEMKDNETLLQGLLDEQYQMIFLPCRDEQEDICCIKYREEHLMFSLPLTHPLSASKSLYLEDLNGENMLLRSQIGFWVRVKDKMPDTRFLIQDDSFAFNELVRASALPSFTTDLVIKRDGPVQNRITIPIEDDEANVTYYLHYLKKDRDLLSPFLKQLLIK